MNLRKLIRETLMNEIKEHTDDEIVNFDDIDLQHEFDKLNKLLFGGQLKYVPMKWNKRKSAHGVVRAYRNSPFDDWRVVHLAMSQFLNITYKNFKDVLAHEMIHVKLIQQNMNVGHGWQFQKEMNRINSMGLGFDVTITANFKEADINPKFTTNSPTVIALVMNTNRYKNMINVMSPNMFDRVHSNVERMFQNITNRGKYRFVNLTYIKSNDPELMRFPSKKKAVSSISYAQASDEFIDRLITSGEIIRTIEIKPQ